MSQNKYITISMIMCLVLCGVLCFLGTPLLKAQADSLEYTETTTYNKVRHNQEYEPTSPVVVPVEYTDYLSFGSYQNRYIDTFYDGDFYTYDFYNNFLSSSSMTLSSRGYIFNGLSMSLTSGTYTFSFYVSDLDTSLGSAAEVKLMDSGSSTIYDNVFTVVSGINYFTFTITENTNSIIFYSNALGTYSNMQVINSTEYVDCYFPYLGTFDSTLGSINMCYSVEPKGLNNNVGQLSFVVPSSYVSQTYAYIKILWLDENLLPFQITTRTITSDINLITIPSNAYYIYFCFAYYNYSQQISDFSLYSGYSYSAEYMDDFYDDLYDYAYDIGRNAGLDEGYSEGYDAGYEDGTSVDVDTAYSNGYDTGYSAGQEAAIDSQTLSFSTMIAGIFNNMGEFLSIEVFPGITIAFLIGLPLLLGAFLIILKLIRG